MRQNSRRSRSIRQFSRHARPSAEVRSDSSIQPWVEIFAPTADGLDAFQQQFERGFVVGDVEVFVVHDQQWRSVIVMEKVAIGFRQAHQVIARNVLLVGNIALLDAFQQRVHRRLQIDHQVGRGCLQLQVLVDLAIKRIFLVAEVEAREQGVFFEKEIRDSGLGEHVALAQFAYLLGALEEEKQLRLQRVSLRVLIETRQEGIGGGIFQQQVD